MSQTMRAILENRPTTVYGVPVVFVGAAVITDHLRVVKNSLPYAIPSEGNFFVAFLYELSSEGLYVLDRVEGISHGHYNRVVVSVLFNNRIYEAFMYVAGDWFYESPATELPDEDEWINYLCTLFDPEEQSRFPTVFQRKKRK